MQVLTSLGNAHPSGLVVSMPDRLSAAVAHRVLELLKAEKVPVVGVLENMHRGTPGSPRTGRSARLSREFGVPFMGALPFDTGVTNAVEKTDVEALLATRFAKELRLTTSVYRRALRTE